MVRVDTYNNNYWMKRSSCINEVRVSIISETSDKIKMLDLDTEEILNIEKSDITKLVLVNPTTTLGMSKSAISKRIEKSALLGMTLQQYEDCLQGGFHKTY